MPHPILFESPLDLDHANGDYSNARDNVRIEYGGPATIAYATIRDTGSGYRAVECHGKPGIRNSAIEYDFSGGMDVTDAASASIVSYNALVACVGIASRMNAFPYIRN